MSQSNPDIEYEDLKAKYPAAVFVDPEPSKSLSDLEKEYYE